jgi:hypothetical protein
MGKNFLIGVLSGVVASLFAIAITQFIKKLLQFIRRKNQGPDLTGPWDVYDRNINLIGNVQINQKGSYVKANLNLIKDSNGNNKFECIGKFSSGQLRLLYEDINMKGYNVGVILLHLCLDNRTLKGKIVYQNHDNGRIVSIGISFKRK